MEQLAASPRNFRVLVVEDDPSNLLVIIELLSQRDYSAVTAATGREALSLFERERVDLVLMDIRMPYPDGFEATSRIRTMEKTTGEHTPIIAVTACALVGDRERCFEAGMDAYVTKPYSRTDLFEAIDEMMSRSTGRRDFGSSAGPSRRARRP
jgi:two-component system, sensor histidine kinase and response regulator